MKVRQLVALIAVLLVIANAVHALAAEMTVADMMEANTLENLLSRHTSVAVLQSMGDSQVATWVNRDYRYTAKRTDETVREGDTELLSMDQYALLFTYIRFKDGGMPFNPLEHKKPDTKLPWKQRRIGGLGIFLVKKKMDDVRYAYEDNKNVLTIEKLFK